MTRILCLWFPNWPIQRLLHCKPELRRRPVALFSNTGRRGNQIVACCEMACRRGVRPGMSLAEAKAVAGKNHLIVELHDPAVDRQALGLLAERCEPFSPRVALEEGNHPASLLLDITGLDHWFANEKQLAEQVTALFACSTTAPAPTTAALSQAPLSQPAEQEAMHPRIAIADTVGAAWAMAHFAHTLEPPPTFPVIVPPGEDPLLFPLPAAALRLPEKVLEMLTRLGIVSIEQILCLPRSSLNSRFGKELLQRIDQLTSRIVEVVEPHRPSPQFSVEWPLEHPVGDRDTLALLIRQLVDRLAVELLNHDQGVVQLIISLQCNPQEQRCFHIGLFHPSAAAEHIQELVELQLENFQLPAPVHHVQVVAATTARLALNQHELFSDDRPTNTHERLLLVNRLSSRLGTEAVLQPQLKASVLPEQACRNVPWADRSGKSSGRKPSLPPGPRPLLLYRPPRPIKLVRDSPTGLPQCAWINRQRQNITRSWGPERIETGWWRGPSVQRDYYRIETATGSRLWVFRQLNNNGWFLHGEFV